MEFSAVTLSGRCLDSDGNVVTHTVSLDRHGHVSSPEHPSLHDFEQVAETLGGGYDSFCARLQWASHVVLRREPHIARSRSFPPPNIHSWNFSRDQDALWTDLVRSTINTAILGAECTAAISAPLALAATQEFVRRDVLPDSSHNWQEMLSALTHPDTHGNGWRRSTPASSRDIAALLDAGAAPELVADYYALGVPCDLVSQAVAVLRSRHLPQLALLRYVATHSLTDAREFFANFDADKADELLVVQ
jgi:hypothetical protein